MGYVSGRIRHTIEVFFTKGKEDKKKEGKEDGKESQEEGHMHMEREEERSRGGIQLKDSRDLASGAEDGNLGSGAEGGGGGKALKSPPSACAFAINRD